MEYKKIVNDDYTLHLIKTDRFKTIKLSLRFTKLYDSSEYSYLKLLERVLPMNGTKNYKNVNEITKKLENLYNERIVFNSLLNSKNMSFNVNMSIVNPMYTDKSMYKESFDMLRDILCNPIIKDNSFNNFDLHRDNIINSLMNIKDNPHIYGSMLFNELFYEGTVYADNNYRHLDEFKSLSNSTLVDVYKKLFNTYKIDVIVMGDYDEEEILKNTSMLLKGFKSVNNTSNDLYLDIKSKYKIDKEKYESSQSDLFVGLTFKDITEFESDYVLVLLNSILGCMNNSILFVNVREKNSLCYHIGSTINKFTNTLVISSGINKDNFDKTLKLIKSSIESMKNTKVIDGLLDNAKRTLDIAFNDFYESQFKVMDYYYLREFINVPSIEDRRSNINNVTSKDIVSLVNKIEIKEVFLLEGVSDEED